MWLEMFLAGKHGKTKDNTIVTKVVAKGCSADNTALFQHCSNIYIGNSFNYFCS